MYTSGFSSFDEAFHRLTCHDLYVYIYIWNNINNYCICIYIYIICIYIYMYINILFHIFFKHWDHHGAMGPSGHWSVVTTTDGLMDWSERYVSSHVRHPTFSWLVVWNMNFMTFHIYIYIYIGNNDPNWLSYIFHRGRAQPPSSFSWISQIATGHGFVWKIDVKNHPMAISMGNMMISTLHLPQGAPCWRRAIPGCLRKPVIPGLWCLPQSFFR